MVALLQVVVVVVVFVYSYNVEFWSLLLLWHMLVVLIVMVVAVVVCSLWLLWLSSRRAETCSHGGLVFKA